MMENNELLTLLNTLNTAKPNANIYFIERIKDTKCNGENTHFQVLKTNISESISDKLREILINSLTRTSRVAELEFLEYDPSAEVNDRPIIEWINVEEIPGCNEILSGMADHVSLPAMPNEIEEILPRLWAYGIDLSTSDTRCVYFRKYSQSKVFKKSRLDAFLFRDGRLSSIDNDIITIDEKVDCVSINEKMYILNKAPFELIFNYLDQYIDKVRGVVSSLETSGFFDNPAALLDLGKSDYRKIKRLATAAELVASGRIGDDFLDKAMEMKEKFSLNFDVDEEAKQIIIARGSVWDIIKLLADDFLASDLTEECYEVQSKRKRK